MRDHQGGTTGTGRTDVTSASAVANMMVNFSNSVLDTY